MSSGVSLWILSGMIYHIMPTSAVKWQKYSPHSNYAVQTWTLSYTKNFRRATLILWHNRRPYWWGGVVNLFWHVTAVLQFDWLMLWSDWLNTVTCRNKFTTPPHQYRRLYRLYKPWSRQKSNLKHFDDKRSDKWWSQNFCSPIIFSVLVTMILNHRFANSIEAAEIP